MHIQLLIVSSVLELSKLKKKTATAPQPQSSRFFRYFAIFKNVANSLEACETPSNSVSPGSKLHVCKTFLNIVKHDETMKKNQFTGTATQPQRNRKFRQFNNDCTTINIEENAHAGNATQNIHPPSVQKTRIHMQPNTLHHSYIY